MKVMYSIAITLFATLALAEEQEIVETKSAVAAEKKQDKRGINSIGYAYGSSGLGYDGLGGYSGDYTNGGYIAPGRVNYINGGGLGGYGALGNGYSSLGGLNTYSGYPSTLTRSGLGYNNGYNRGYGGYNSYSGALAGYPTSYSNFALGTGGYSGLGTGYNGYSTIGNGYSGIGATAGYSGIGTGYNTGYSGIGTGIGSYPYTRVAGLGAGGYSYSSPGGYAQNGGYIY